MIYKIALIPGDTVGPELIRQVAVVLSAMGKRTGNTFQTVECIAGAAAVRRFGAPLPAASLRTAADCDAAILGNIGEQGFASAELKEKPEYALLELRKAYGVCTNIRPVFIRRGLEELSPLKHDFIKNGFDILLVRDILGGMLNGPRSNTHTAGGYMASDLELYHESTVIASAKTAFEIASLRKHHVTSLDKANVLATSLLWRKTVTALSADYPGIHLSHQYIDNAAMNVIKSPGDFDVILTSNVFGDILSDELAQLSGVPNLFGSAELAPDKKGIYTPNQLHHPNEEYAGQNIVSPLGILNAVSMMLDFTLCRPDLARLLETAIEHLFSQKLTTPEIPVPGFRQISTDEMGQEIADYLMRS